MSWIYGNKRWTSSFKSLNGTTCRIDIYMQGYNGVFVQDVVAAADPFFYEEDDSDDLLNDVMRYRTGYIRLVEQQDGGTTSLDDIYPTDIFDRYVEVYYGQSLIFNGYIQVQDFSRELVPVPRVIELPVISPLGLLENRKFSNTNFMPPSSVTLGELLDVALANEYDSIYIPYNYGGSNQVSLAMKVSTLVVSPWNEDYHYSMNIAPYNKVMTGQSYSYIIEGICKAFGWICHDTPGALVFTAFDHEGYYQQWPVGHIGETGYDTSISIPSTPLALEDYFTLADDQAEMTTLQPDTGIEIDYEGEKGNREFTFKHFYVPTEDPVVIMPSFIPDGDIFPNHAEIFSLCSLLPVQNTGETNLIGTFTFDANDKLNIGTHAVAWNGKEGVMISMGSYQSGTTLFYVRFYFRRRSGMKYSLSYDILVRSDGALGGLAARPDQGNDSYIITQVDDNVSHMDYVQVNFKYYYLSNPLPTQALVFIHNIKLEICEQGVPYEEYLYKPASDSDFIPNTGNPPVVSSSITMPISMYRLNDNLIGDAVQNTKVTEYTYLFTPRKLLVSRFRYAAALTLPHAQLLSYLRKKWRIIAQRFDPWNDEFKLTMQNSSVL